MKKLTLFLYALLFASSTYAAVPFPGAVCDGVADDTAAIQAAVQVSNVNYSMDHKMCVISQKITFPDGLRWMGISSTKFKCVGDIDCFSTATPTALVAFLRFEDIFVSAKNQSKYRRVFNWTGVAHSVFDHVWVDGTANNTQAFYANGNGGSGSYYNDFSNLYVGNSLGGFWVEDNNSPSMTANSNTIRSSRFQPGLGNIAIYLGKNSQNINVIGNQCESPGGWCAYIDGTGHNLEGNRLESMTIGFAVNGSAVGNRIGHQYWSSNGTKINWGGSSFNNNCKVNGAGCVY